MAEVAQTVEKAVVGLTQMTAARGRPILLWLAQARKGGLRLCEHNLSACDNLYLLIREFANTMFV